MPKVGIVLERGLMRGIFTLDTMLENNIEIGVSAGTLFGINYFSKQKGRVIRYNKNILEIKDISVHTLY